MKPGMLFLILTMAGCTVTQVADTSGLLSSAVDLREEYIAASSAVVKVTNEVPTEDGLKLLSLKIRADKLLEDVDRHWLEIASLDMDQIDSYYQRGKQIYIEAEALVIPRLPYLSQDTILSLSKIRQAAIVVDLKYQTIAGFKSQNSELVRAGMELVVLALKIGVLTL